MPSIPPEVREECVEAVAAARSRALLGRIVDGWDEVPDGMQNIIRRSVREILEPVWPILERGNHDPDA